MLSEAHARGLKVVPWTCDDPATVKTLMDLGVDGIITNYPNHVRDIMAERGMRLPEGLPGPLTCRRRLCLLAGPAVSLPRGRLTGHSVAVSRSRRHLGVHVGARRLVTGHGQRFRARAPAARADHGVAVGGRGHGVRADDGPGGPP